MPEFKKVFEQGDFEKKPPVPYEELKTPFKKETYQKGALDEQGREDKEDVIDSAIKQEYYDKIIEELRSKKRGGADFHFSQISIGELSKNREALDLYKLHTEDQLEEEKIRRFLAKVPAGSNEYNFGAMLLTWSLDRTEEKRVREKELLKKEAEQKLIELKTAKPHIAAYVDNINLDLLKRLDLKVIKDLNEQSFIDYEKNLREYFKNKTEGKKEIKREVEKDPRYQWYCMLREVLDLGPGRPDIFIG